MHCNRIDENGVIKVSDFGLTEDIYLQNYFRENEGSSVKLPIKWMALESIRRAIFSEKTDVVSAAVAGVVLSTSGIHYESKFSGHLVFYVGKYLHLETYHILLWDQLMSCAC